ncbi:MAG: glycosyltransferase [Bacteroidota bacterium]
MTQLSDITLLVTHFNRSESLSRLLQTLSNIGLSFTEIIISDGGSNDKHLNEVIRLRDVYNYTLLTTEENKGLGNSINVGQDAAKTNFIVYIQEDFVPKPAFKAALIDGLEIIKSEPKWDLVRFYAFPWAPFPYRKPYKKGFSELIFSLSPFYTNHNKFYVYADHPHIKRKTFPEKFGRYVETLSGDVTEMAMCRSFLKNQGEALYFDRFEDLFEHDNPEDEPGQFRPDYEKRKKFSDIKPLYKLYLKFKVLKETVSYILAK